MCGSRTTPCEKCGKFVVMKDLKRHLERNCGEVEEAKSPVRSAQKTVGKIGEKARGYHRYTVAVRVIRPARTHPDQLLQATSLLISSSPPPSPFLRRAYF